MIVPDFDKWARGFSGCDGGNLCGKTWLCGIEYGGNDTEESFNYYDVSVPGSWGTDGEWSAKDTADFLRHPYNRRAAKLLRAMEGCSEDTEKIEAFVTCRRCFHSVSGYFKLNLFPISFPTTADKHWQPWHTRKTGLANKKEYRGWCRSNRFPELERWVREHKPRLIICTGKTSRDDFLNAFATDPATVGSSVVAGKTISYGLANDGKTLVAVIYFLGNRWGLRSDTQLDETGRALRKLRDTLLVEGLA